MWEDISSMATSARFRFLIPARTWYTTELNRRRINQRLSRKLIWHRELKKTKKQKSPRTPKTDRNSLLSIFYSFFLTSASSHSRDFWNENKSFNLFSLLWSSNSWSLVGFFWCVSRYAYAVAKKKSNTKKLQQRKSRELNGRSGEKRIGEFKFHLLSLWSSIKCMKNAWQKTSLSFILVGKLDTPTSICLSTFRRERVKSKHSTCSTANLTIVMCSKMPKYGHDWRHSLEHDLVSVEFSWLSIFSHSNLVYCCWPLMNMFGDSMRLSHKKFHETILRWIMKIIVDLFAYSTKISERNCDSFYDQLKIELVSVKF